MPTILYVQGWRFHFYSNEGNEPIHVHVQSGSSSAKIWLNPLRLQSSKGFNQQQINEVLKIVKKHAALFERKWREYFKS